MEPRSTVGHGDKVVGRRVVSPRCRYVARRAGFIGVEKAILAPTIAELDQFELLPAERVKGVSDPEHPHRRRPIECIRE